MNLIKLNSDRFYFFEPNTTEKRPSKDYSYQNIKKVDDKSFTPCLYDYKKQKERIDKEEVDIMERIRPLYSMEDIIQVILFICIEIKYRLKTETLTQCCFKIQLCVPTALVIKS